jgi:serralysin
MADIQGTAADDGNLRGTNAADTIYGLGGNDTLAGEGGNDTLYGGDGNDRLDGGIGNDLVDGGGGDDVFTVLSNGGDDTLIGGGGMDQAFVYRSRAVGLTFTLESPDMVSMLGGISLTGIERISVFLAGTTNDTLTGGAFDDVFRSGAGNDTLNGRGGDDYLNGEEGIDSLYGGAGNDDLYSFDYSTGQDALLDGGEGIDFATISRATSSATLTLSIADPTITSMLGTTAVRGVERITYYGGTGSDTITGGALNDFIQTSRGDDTLIGGAGDDTLYAEDGQDIIEGGAGSDLIRGGSGIDTARYDGARADYSIEQVSNSLRIRDLRGAGTDVDTVYEVDTFVFSDRTFLGGNTSTPTAITLTTSAVDEAAATGTVVGTLATTDADLIESFTYALLDGAGGRFALGAGNTIIVADGTLLDFENMAAHNITVRVTDRGGLTYTQVLSVAVRDVAEPIAETITTPDGSFTAPTDDAYVVTGAEGANAITTAGGDDIVLGAGADDVIATGDGDDTIVYEGLKEGYDSVDGGAGTDRLVAARDGSAIGVTSFTGIEAISANGHAGVFLRASGRSETLDFSGVTLDGIARIDAGTGNDTVTGSAGADTILGGGGNDLLRGGGGDDVFLVGRGDGVDRVAGDAGFDTIRADEDGAAIGVQWFTDLEAIDGNGHAGVTIIGTAGDDVLNLTDLAVTGIARIDLSAGNDRFRGSAGADRVVGGKGDDMLYGNGGDDVFEIAAGAGSDTIDGGVGFDTLLVTAPTFTWSGISNVEALTGTALRLNGTAAADTIDLSAVTLTGVARIDAGLGDDTLTASAGADRVALGDGQDVFTGGAGADVFLFERLAQSRVGAADRITDFATGEDSIDLTALDASTRASGDQAFAFIGTAAFTRTAGELRYVVDGDTISLFGDVNGDGRADFQLGLAGAPTLTEADFLL